MAYNLVIDYVSELVAERFHLFPQLKQDLGGHKFKDVCEVGNRCGTTPGNKASAKNMTFRPTMD
jgi:hypothetical protein